MCQGEIMDTCAECAEPIQEGRSVVEHRASGRLWHVMCTPPVEKGERGERRHHAAFAPDALEPADQVALAMLRL